MRLLLPSHVHLAVLGDDVVFLDVAADAYACVPGGADLLRPAPDRRWLAPVHPSVGEALIAAGLAADASGDGPAAGATRALGPRGLPAPRRDIPPKPSRDLASGEDRPTLRERVRLLLAFGDYLRFYRGRTFAEVLSWAAPRPSAGGVPDPREAQRLARLFERCAIWLPLPGKCLARSFVLLRFLQRSGSGAVWVFGVRTWPFSAHCWLQSGEVALDDFAERLVPYEPILALA
ncbi:lasso peptide biosynthesis B2 protein [Phenylobacterium sp.]|uniref:lasso peptide biosynthesis B2 protein n=1 Tax=Phenylobacterium sp. TaxID=1871053 RepID=UPI002F933E1B